MEETRRMSSPAVEEPERLRGMFSMAPILLAVSCGCRFGCGGLGSGLCCQDESGSI